MDDHRPDGFRLNIVDLVLLTATTGLLLGPWVAVRNAESADANREIALLFNAVLFSVILVASILARASGKGPNDSWITPALAVLVANQAVATAVPITAIVLMPVGVVLAAALLLYLHGQLEV